MRSEIVDKSNPRTIVQRVIRFDRFLRGLERLGRLCGASRDTIRTKDVPAGTLTWICNICGASNCSPASEMTRETGFCCDCRATVRFRSLIAILTERLFSRVEILAKMEPHPLVTGLGMSDDDRYAGILSKKFNYINTFYHSEPLLDITTPAPKWFGCSDFVLCSDVFEHVPPPIQPAFDNLWKILKPGGVIVFSVPFMLESETREHYPNLYDFKTFQDSNGDWILENITRLGINETFRNLVFHGGKGSTLEMRLFSLAALQRHFASAGFSDFRVHNEPHFHYGIFWLEALHLIISARRPI